METPTIEGMVQDYCHTMDHLKLKLQGGEVRRYHAMGRWIDQTVEEHTGRVLTILLHLWPNSSRALIVAAHNHDRAEGFLGDLQAPVKRHPELRGPVTQIEEEYERWLGIQPGTLTKVEAAQLKVADSLELYITCSNHLPHPRARAMMLKVEEWLHITWLGLRIDDVSAVKRILEAYREGYNATA